MGLASYLWGLNSATMESMNRNFARTLSIASHPRDNLGLSYVYAVHSRRSGGLSVGINVNPNKACHYRCLYCQVEGLKPGKAPDLDASLLRAELKAFLSEVQREPGGLPLQDIAISGDGEPTSLRDFEGLIRIIQGVMEDLGLLGKLKVVLLTNGTLLHLPGVLKGIELLGSIRGEVWFKLDAASPKGLRLVNSTRVSPLRLYENLSLVAPLCPVWVHTLCFCLDRKPILGVPSERQAYLSWLRKARNERLALRGVILYTMARPSFQPEAPRLSAVSRSWLQALALEVGALGLETRVF